MMLEMSKGNILEADADALVNTVNCVGVMGKGIALQFKHAFPENFHAYERACRTNEVQPGRMLVHSTGRLYPKYIINFPTKRHWKGKSRIEDIESGLVALKQEVKALNICSLAIPPLGCGNGGLDWSQVAPLIKSAFTNMPKVKVLLYAPGNVPIAEEMPIGTTRPVLTKARALLIRLMEQYAIPGYKLSLLEIQKLAYFLQSAGETLRLNFVKHKYGPYADNLNHVLQRLEGHYIRGYGDRSSSSTVHLLGSAYQAAHEIVEDEAESLLRLERVSRLIEGFETPYGMELLATVHWVALVEGLNQFTEDETIAKVREWNERKSNLFTPEHIRKALVRLKDQGWLHSPSNNH
jgi:O-acetyl-ADP-ribose deacetylase (regulator of RNase III)